MIFDEYRDRKLCTVPSWILGDVATSSYPVRGAVSMGENRGVSGPGKGDRQEGATCTGGVGLVVLGWLPFVMCVNLSGCDF